LDCDGLWCNLVAGLVDLPHQVGMVEQFLYLLFDQFFDEQWVVNHGSLPPSEQQNVLGVSLERLGSVFRALKHEADCFGLIISAQQ
jgi:hypothetical protein